MHPWWKKGCPWADGKRRASNTVFVTGRLKIYDITSTCVSYQSFDAVYDPDIVSAVFVMQLYLVCPSRRPYARHSNTLDSERRQKSDHCQWDEAFGWNLGKKKMVSQTKKERKWKCVRAWPAAIGESSSKLEIVRVWDCGQVVRKQEEEKNACLGRKAHVMKVFFNIISFLQAFWLTSETRNIEISVLRLTK